MSVSKVSVHARMNEGLRTEVDCSHPFVIDQPVNAGGTDAGPNPLELFIATLPGCICAIGRIIAMQRKITLRSIDVKADGEIDKDFLLGRTTEGRAGFISIHADVKIDADLSREEKEAFLQDIEKRCPIADNMSGSTKLTVQLID